MGNEPSACPADDDDTPGTPVVQLAYDVRAPTCAHTRPRAPTCAHMRPRAPARAHARPHAPTPGMVPDSHRPPDQRPAPTAPREEAAALRS
eukprot:5469458-Prymnesium_polylepis.1